MSSARTPHNRRALLVVVALLFFVTAGIAIWRVMALRELAIERERTRIQQYLEDSVDAWETALLTDLAERSEQVAENPERAFGLQRKWRESKKGFDASFLWLPRTEVTAARVIFPSPSTPDASLKRQTSLCVARAHHLLRESPTDLDTVVAALVGGCRGEDPSVRLYAGIRAATLLTGAQRYAEALAALDATGIREGATLREAARLGIDPFQLAAHRLARIDLQLRTGAVDEALTLAERVGDELADLEAPDLAAANNWMHEILQILARAGRVEAQDRLKEKFTRADRRYGAYAEVVDRLLLEPFPSGERTGRMVVDAYSDHPFLLHYGWANGLGVAFSLEEGPLVEEFLELQPRELRRAITLTDARTGRWVAGARSGGRYAVGVQFRRTLTHLRVNVRQVALDAAVGATSEQWLVPAVVIGVCAALGLVLLAALDRTTRQQFELFERQRAFGTRVTHELKTPLAGIRVMAENLEIGAFRDDRQRQEMAHRIVQEADTLTRRVDEVLAAAKERTIPSPVPFDPEDLVYALVDEWGPRFGDAGVAFTVDVQPTDPVLGDPDAFRDAVACLLDNALKYRREGAASKVQLTVVPDGRQVVLTVTDNGLGVPKAMRKRIFDRFVRVEGPNRGKAGGHGLGLHQVREIVAAHRGTVTCADGIDGGASFVVRLPAHRGARR